MKTPKNAALYYVAMLAVGLSALAIYAMASVILEVGAFAL